MSTLTDWEEGTITDVEALRALCGELARVELDLKPLTAQREAIRAGLERIVARLDGRASVPAFGTLAITGGGTRVSWDTRGLDTLIAKLARNGLADLAEELAATRRESPVAASLRITRERLEGGHGDE